MKKFKMLFAAAALVLLIGVAGAYASESPSSALADFKEQLLEQKKAILDQRVEEGTMTQEKADQIYDNIKSNQENCDCEGECLGNGSCLGAENGFGKGIGQGNRNGQENGLGVGNGQCNGNGQGQGCGMRLGNNTGGGLNN